MFDVNNCLAEAEEQMEMAIMHLEDEFAHIRAGKANVRILDDIRVDSYGSMVALNNVAALSTPDARTIAIRPWDKNMIKVIEKAIIDSSVGIMPTNNGEIIRLAIPPLTEAVHIATLQPFVDCAHISIRRYYIKLSCRPL